MKSTWFSLLPEVLRKEKHFNIKPINIGGSDRMFYRVSNPSLSVIVCQAVKGDEFEDYVQLASFLKEKGVPVPSLLAYSLDGKVAVFEDVGQLSLQEEALATQDKNQLVSLYKLVLDQLVFMQFIEYGECRPIVSRRFGYDDYRWETEYFRQYLLGEYFKLDVAGDNKLTEEFERLAKNLQDEPLYVMHRDFQSQNIYLKEKKVSLADLSACTKAGPLGYGMSFSVKEPEQNVFLRRKDKRVYFLDFQASRLGPLGYDLASLLKDPYVSLPEDVQQKLISYYFAILRKNLPAQTNFWQFYEKYLFLAQQRLMQALGAYAFLSLVKGKRVFASYIKPALTLLKNVLKEQGALPYLSSILRNLPDQA